MKDAWKNMVCMLAGLWLWISPFVLHYKLGSDASGDASIAGIFIGALAMMAVAVPRPWEEWSKLALGLWLLVSPWLLGFTNQPVSRDNIMVVGLLVVALSFWSLASRAEPRRQPAG